MCNLQCKMQRAFVLFIAVLMCLIVSGLSAKSPADYDAEINYAIEMNKPDTTIARMYMEYQYLIYISDINKAIDYLKKAEKIYTKEKDQVKLAAVLSRLGQLYHQLQIYDIALEYLTKAHAIHSKLDDYAGYGYNNCDIANVFFAFKQYDMAESYYRQSLKLFAKHKDFYGMSVMNNNIGLCKIEINQPDSALYYFTKGYELRQKKNDKYQILHSINYLAIAYNAQEETDLAIKKFLEVIDEIRNWQDAPQYAVQLMADAQYYLHEVYHKLNRQDVAEQFLSEAYSSYNKVSDNAGIIKILLIQADVHFANKNYSRADELAEQAYQLAQKSGLTSSAQKAAKTLTRINMEKGDKAKAKEYFKLFSDLSDSMMVQFKTSGITQTHAAIQTFYKDREYQALKDRESYIRRFFLIIGLLFLSVVSLLFYVIFTRRSSIMRLKQFANATFEAILIHHKSIIMEVNDQLCKYTGYTREEVINKDYRDINLVKLSEETKKAIRGVEIAHYEGTLVHKDGTEMVVEVTSRPFPYHNKMMRVVALRDITDQKQYIKDLLAINLQNKELIATKDKLFSIIAHDLRNPFNAIINFSNMLKKDIKAYNEEELMEIINMIHDSSHFAHNLLSNLLDWARIQTGALSFSPKRMLLITQISNAVDIVWGGASSKQITIKTDIEKGSHIYADAHMLRTILLNLLSNAIKFTPINGVISVKGWQDDKQTTIVITDSGVGINQKRLSKLFNADNPYSTQGTNQEQGTGLGLLICHEMIHKHEGTIEVNSIEGEGTSFEIKLPLPQ